MIVFNKIIDSYSVNEGFGLPIGNLTSQYFANYYLSYIDHYMKEVQKVPLYVRYMDDILIFGDDKSSINRAYSCISLLMNEHYLQLKHITEFLSLDIEFILIRCFYLLVVKNDL